MGGSSIAPLSGGDPGGSLLQRNGEREKPTSPVTPTLVKKLGSNSYVENQEPVSARSPEPLVKWSEVRKNSVTSPLLGNQPREKEFAFTLERKGPLYSMCADSKTALSENRRLAPAGRQTPAPGSGVVSKQPASPGLVYVPDRSLSRPGRGRGSGGSVRDSHIGQLSTPGSPRRRPGSRRQGRQAGRGYRQPAVTSIGRSNQFGSRPTGLVTQRPKNLWGCEDGGKPPLPPHYPMYKDHVNFSSSEGLSSPTELGVITRETESFHLRDSTHLNVQAQSVVKPDLTLNKPEYDFMKDLPCEVWESGASGEGGDAAGKVAVTVGEGDSGEVGDAKANRDVGECESVARESEMNCEEETAACCEEELPTEQVGCDGERSLEDSRTEGVDLDGKTTPSVDKLERAAEASSEIKNEMADYRDSPHEGGGTITEEAIPEAEPHSATEEAPGNRETAFVNEGGRTAEVLEEVNVIESGVVAEGTVCGGVGWSEDAGNVELNSEHDLAFEVKVEGGGEEIANMEVVEGMAKSVEEVREKCEEVGLACSSVVVTLSGLEEWCQEMELKGQPEMAPDKIHFVEETASAVNAASTLLVDLGLPMEESTENGAVMDNVGSEVVAGQTGEPPDGGLLEEPPVVGQSVEPPSCNPPTVELPAGNPLTMEPLYDSPSAVEPPVGCPPAVEPLAGSCPVAEPLAGSPPVAEPPAGSPPIAEPLAGSPPAGSLLVANRRLEVPP